MGLETLKKVYNNQEESVEDLYSTLVILKKQITVICSKPSIEDNYSPIKTLAKFWNDHPSMRPEELEHAYASFVCKLTEKESGKTFAHLIIELKNTFIDQLLNETINLSIIDHYLNTVDENPMGDLLKQELAGLPPIHSGAETNVGLPVPEDHKNKFKGLFCSVPFEYAQVDPLGNLYQCCPQTLPESAGNLFDKSFMDVWNSEQAKKIRGSILDGSFKYCSEATCGVLQQRNLPKVTDIEKPFHKAIIKHKITTLKKGPKTINMSYDRSCNLACESCRSDFIILKGKAKQRAEDIHENVVNIKHLKDVQRLIITGSGDPFGSKLYHSFLRNFDPKLAPKLRITLSTNGLLLNEKTWSNICSKAIDRVELSVDGASQTSYTANRGGDFTLLVRNLEFIGRLRKQKKLKVFELHFVVQKNNFFEMKNFVELGRRVNADMIIFKQIVNWGTYSEQNYLERAVQLKQNALHQVFKNLLQDPIFDSEDVYMHDLSHLIITKKGKNSTVTV
jgi:MoaA/NifB/PqqE/SkfB family radical SAM enzyme